MKSTYSVSEAQARLPRLLKEAEKGEPVCILRHNQPVAYVVSRERMEAIVETMEILSSPDAMRAIRAHKRGKTKFVAVESLDDE